MKLFASLFALTLTASTFSMDSLRTLSRVAKNVSHCKMAPNFVHNLGRDLHDSVLDFYKAEMKEVQKQKLELKILQFDRTLSSLKRKRILMGTGISGGCWATYKLPYAVGLTMTLATMGSSMWVPIASAGATVILTSAPTVYLTKKFYDTTKTINAVSAERDVKVKELEELKNK